MVGARSAISAKASLIARMIVHLADNYDSFTWNLAHLIGEAGAEVRVHRNDSMTPEEILGSGADAVVISPGPCTPNEAGVSLDLVAACEASGTPLLGVCLGHQAIAQAFGARVERASRLMHGKTSPVAHDGTGVLAGVPSPFTATRYHSLSVPDASLTARLRVTARAEDDGEIMALTVPGTRIHGVQFHPESIASEAGALIVANFLAEARAEAAA